MSLEHPVEDVVAGLLLLSRYPNGSMVTVDEGTFAVAVKHDDVSLEDITALAAVNWYPGHGSQYEMEWEEFYHDPLGKRVSNYVRY